MTKIPSNPKIKLEAAEPVWDVAERAPALHAALRKRIRWAAEVYPQFRGRVPVARTCEVFSQQPFFRPVRHVRSFYLRGPAGRKLAFKGTELLADDVDATLEHGLLFRGFGAGGRWPFTEHLPLVEHKVPWALLLESEAVAEAEKAAAFQSDHLKRYGELAAVPFPLLVCRWPRSVAAAHAKRLLPRLSDFARRTVQRLLEEGAGCYIYHYPSTAVRVTDLNREIPSCAGGQGYARRKKALAGRMDAEEVVSRWLTLFARMLALGYFPYTLSHHDIGNCLQPQNAVVDGGFADVDSLQRIADVKDPAEFDLTVLTMVGEFSKTVLELLRGNGSAEDEVGAYLRRRVADELARRLRRESRGGARPDPRLMRLLEGGAFFEDVEAVLSRAYPRIASRHIRNE